MMKSLNWISAKSIMKSWMRHGWDAMKGFHESRSTHSLGFVLSYDVVVEYISIKIVYFHLTYYGLFCYSKFSSSLIRASIPYHFLNDITVNTHCDQTMGWCCCLGNYVMSQWVGDIVIDTKQSCDQQLGSFTRSTKTWIFYTRSRW